MTSIKLSWPHWPHLNLADLIDLIVVNLIWPNLTLFDLTSTSFTVTSVNIAMFVRLWILRPTFHFSIYKQYIFMAREKNTLFALEKNTLFALEKNTLFALE